MRFSQKLLMELSPSTIPSLIFSSFFLFAHKFLSFLPGKSKFLHAFRYLLVSSFLFFLRLLPSLFPTNFFPSFSSSSSSSENNKFKSSFNNYTRKSTIGGEQYVGANVGTGGVATGASVATCDSGIARALSQLLFIVNDIPVNSRKYDVVRTLAERLIDENLQDGNDALIQVNCNVLSAAFVRALSQLEAVMMEQSRGLGLGVVNGDLTNVTTSRDAGYYAASFSQFVRVVRYCSDVVWSRGKSRDELSGSRNSADKLAAELLWLAQKMAACRCADEAVHKWASASNLAWLSLTTEPRLQGSIVKISGTFLFSGIF